MENKKGTVYLLGAGPGEEGLMTERGSALLKKAEVLLYDRLVNPVFLTRAPGDCERIPVGKREGNHTAVQEEINALLVEKAKQGKCVVRLKGGDPFVFGRGGEEIKALEEAGIPYEVIPGITSAIAALEAAGIPVTHRKEARSFHVITGHTAEGEDTDRFEQYAGLEGTLIVLMGVGNAAKIADALMKGGKSPETPAAVVEQGTCFGQRRTDASLGTLAETIQAEGIQPPAVLVIGETARYHMVSRNRPLWGRRIAVTGTGLLTGKLAEGLRDLGAKVYAAPYLSVQPTELLAEGKVDFQSYDWLVFTSVNGVHTFFTAMKKAKRDIRELFSLRFAVIGTGTAKALAEYGIYADFLPSRYTVEALAEELPQKLEKGERVLLLRAQQGSKELNRIWDEKGIAYEDLGIYRIDADTRMVKQLLADSGTLDTITFASSSGVTAFMEELKAYEKEGGSVSFSGKYVCIGHKTAETLESYLPKDRDRILTAREYTAEGLMAACLENKERKESGT